MIYLRFGAPPACGRSRLFSWADWEEVGVSAFEGRETARGYEILLTHFFQVNDLTRVLKEGRPLYRVWGREIGRGLSGEPLLADVTRAELVGPGAEITVRNAGICSVYLGILLDQWAGAQKPPADLEAWDRGDSTPAPRTPPLRWEPGVFEQLNATARKHLEEWGLLEDFDATMVPHAPPSAPGLYPAAEHERLRRWARDLENELAKTTNERRTA